MGRTGKQLALALALSAGALGSGVGAAFEIETSGFVSAELRGFADSPLSARQRRHSASMALQPEFYGEWDNGAHSVLFVPFARIDSADIERTHWDIRELMWRYVDDEWEVGVGIGKVFWGVTESQHLVDIINQTDLVESLDGEDKLGQPMVTASFSQAWGVLDLFVLPGFRERTFPGERGRLRTQPRVDASQARFESGAGRGHIDIAARWSHTFDTVDVALSHFYGTSRDPSFIPGLTSAREVVLIPFYKRIHQTGLELQYTDDAWLWKLEVIRRSGQGDAFYALTGGFEYTFFGFADTAADLGVIGEYLYDDRGELGGTAFQKDVLLGLRLALNDEQSTEMLAGVITDLDDGSHLFSLEGSRRLSDNLKLTVEGRIFSDVPQRSPFRTLRRDDYVQFELAWFF